MIDYVKYLDLFEQGNSDEANAYRVSEVPQRLFKYCSLKTATDSKLKALEENKIYLSDFDGFNDPFEGRFLRFDDDGLRLNGWNPKEVRKFYKEIGRRVRYTCLTGTNENNMPMWAYYADNHQGFCVEYMFTERQKHYIYPVTYETYDRPIANSVVTNLMYSYMKLTNGGKGIEDITANEETLMQMLIVSLASKHESWQHEKEYRIIAEGSMFFPAAVRKIYIGLNCSSLHREMLVSVGKKLKCEVYQMSLDENSKMFELVPISM